MTSATITDEAQVLRTHPLGESGLIVVVATKNHGIRHFVAKGIRSPKNILHGKIDLFFHLYLTWNQGGKSPLKSIKEISLISPRDQIRKNYINIVMGIYFSKLIENSTPQEEYDPHLYDLLTRALEFLNVSLASRKALLHFEKELVKILGLSHPSLPPNTILEQYLSRLPTQREKLLKLLE